MANIDLDEFNRLRGEVDRLRKAASRAEGAYQQARKTLAAEIGEVEDLAKVREYLDSLEVERDTDARRYEKSLQKLYRDYGSLIEEVGDGYRS